MGGGSEPPRPTPGYALAQDLKKRSLASYAGGIMLVTEKNLINTGFLVKFCFIQNLDLKN